MKDKLTEFEEEHKEELVDKFLTDRQKEWFEHVLLEYASVLEEKWGKP